MRALDWLHLLQEYARDHNKRVFTMTELANLAGAELDVLRVTLRRLQQQRVILRLAQGLYGPAPVAPEILLAYLDPCAYLTDFAALYHHGHIDQVPTRYTCFTSRRHSSRLRSTIGGCVELIAIKEPIYSFPTGGDAPIASPEQAFLDYLYRCRLVDVRAQGLVFRRLHELRPDILNQLGSRYPRTVRIAAEKMLASHGGASSAGSPSASSCTRHSDGATAR